MRPDPDWVLRIRRGELGLPRPWHQRRLRLIRHRQHCLLHPIATQDLAAQGCPSPGAALRESPAAAVLAASQLSGGSLGQRRGGGDRVGTAAAGTCGGARVAPGTGTGGETLCSPGL